jgi:hypothetical protein
MALPENTTTLVVVGNYLTPTGQPSTGSVTFVPSRWLTNPGADVAIPNSPVTVTLGTAGEFEVTLPVTDDDDLQPANWFYRVQELVDGVSQSYDILLPASAGTNGTAFLADIAPAAELGPEYASIQGPPGPTGPSGTLTVGTIGSTPFPGPGTVTDSGTPGAAVLDFVLVDGPTGPQGSAATVTVGTVTAGTVGGTPTVTNSGTSGDAVLDFVLIPGDKGDQGDLGPIGPQGSAATIEVGTVTTGTAGGTVSVTNSGTTGSAVLDFVIPRGDKGDKGDTGDTGAPGAAASITVGTVTSVAFGGTAEVTNSGTSGSAVLDFVLVTGPQGDLAGLSANEPLDYSANTFSLLFGAGLGTATGGTLVADLSDATPQSLGAAASGTATTISRADHVHAEPTAADIGAVGTATTITAGTGLSGGGDLSASRTLDVEFSDSNPAALGTAAAGTATTASRSDHVHAEQDLSGLVAKAEVTAKGDLIVASGNAAIDNLAVGTDGHVLTADSNETLGVKWSAPTGGGGAGLADVFLLMGA